MMDKKLLIAKGIDKSFSGVPVLKKVNLDINAGEVVSLIGMNGAGKSTLFNVIAGVHEKDGGEIYIDGELAKIQTPNDAERYGVSMVHQEPTLCENMRVYENIFLNNELKKGMVLDRAKMMQESRRILDYLGFTVDVTELAENLSLVEKGVVSIAQAMLMDPKILILDEVTAPLNQKEVEHLFEVINTLRDKGMGIIFISHKIKEIITISDRVCVLKDGENVGTFDKKEGELNEGAIIRLMLGETEGWHSEYSEKDLSGEIRGEPQLELRHLSREGQFEDISLSLHKGEIIGMAGLKGAGITELMLSVFGVIQPDSGEIIKDGAPVEVKTPKQAIRQGICMVTNDRQKEGLALELSIEENVAVASLGKLRAKGGFVSQKSISQSAKQFTDKLSVKMTGLKQIVQFLSGGNQQKVVIAKWLLNNADVIMVDEPTRGIDVSAKNDIYDLLLEEKKDGKSILMFSPEIRELLNVCDRIVVVSMGKLVCEINKGDSRFNEAEVMECMHSF